MYKTQRHVWISLPSILNHSHVSVGNFPVLLLIQKRKFDPSENCMKDVATWKFRFLFVHNKPKKGLKWELFFLCHDVMDFCSHSNGNQKTWKSIKLKRYYIYLWIYPYNSNLSCDEKENCERDTHKYVSNWLFLFSPYILLLLIFSASFKSFYLQSFI